MGYYSDFSFEIFEARVDPEKAKALEEFFSSLENDEIYGFYGVKLVLGKENELFDISLEEYYAKFYDDDVFAEKLSEVLTQGKVHLHFAGEDGVKWGYEVTPGEVKELSYLVLTSEEYEKMENCPRAVQAILEALREKDDSEVVVKSAASGFQYFKFPAGTTAGEVKITLFYLLRDLAIDLDVAISEEKLKKELLGEEEK